MVAGLGTAWHLGKGCWWGLGAQDCCGTTSSASTPGLWWWRASLILCNWLVLYLCPNSVLREFPKIKAEFLEEFYLPKFSFFQVLCQTQLRVTSTVTV